MTDYTIMEYDEKTRKYITVGYATAYDSDEAKLKFIEKNTWKPRRGVVLFAKPPVCR